MTDTPTSEILARVPLFAALPDEEIGRFAAATESVAHPSGSAVLTEGHPADALYVIDRGSAAVIKDDRNLIALLGPGDHFGEVSLLDALPCSASVVTREETLLWRISRERFEALLGEDPARAVAVYRAIQRVLCERLRNANEMVSVLMGAVV